MLTKIKGKKLKKNFLISAFTAVVIFNLDVWTPLGTAMGVLYVIPIVISLQEERKLILIIAALCTFLTVIVFLLSLSEITPMTAYANRVFSLLAIWTVTIIVIRHNLFQKMKEQNELLKQKNEQLEKYALIASHDLKEPLRTIQSFADILVEDYSDQLENKAREYLGFITDAAKRLKIMIHGLLLYSKLGRSGNFQPLDLNSIINDIQADLALKITTQNAIIHCATLPRIKGLPTEIRQLFQNLITNALKFQRKEIAPKVTISVIEKKNHWQFSVADNGIGIALDQQQKIFGFFSKLHQPSKYEGQGIGLAFCKKIVELHHGEIWVESTENVGSTFYFTLSKKP